MAQVWPLLHPTVREPQALVTVPQVCPAGKAAAVGSVQHVPFAWQASPGGQGMVSLPQALVTVPQTSPAGKAAFPGSAQHWWVVVLHPSPLGQFTVKLPHPLVSVPQAHPAGSAVGMEQHWPTPPSMLPHCSWPPSSS
jgi:hypothetical protein